MSLNLNSETLGGSVSTINLCKVSRGQRINLSKEQPSLKNILMKVVWTGSADVDASLMLLNKNGRAYLGDNPKTMVWYGNLTADGIKHSGDLRTGGTEEISITLDAVNNAVDQLVFMGTTYTDSEPADTFGLVRECHVYLINADTKEALYQFDLVEDHSTATAVELATLYRHNGEWKMRALEEDLGTFHQGLQAALNTYI